MAPEQQHSAEKDLLKIIENPAAADAQKKAADEKPALTAAPAKVEKKSLLGMFAKREKGANKKSASGAPLDRGIMIKALFAVSIAALGYFIYTAFSEQKKLQKAKDLVKFDYIVDGKEQGVLTGAIETTPEILPVPEKEEGFRNIFKPWSQKKEEVKKDPGTLAVENYRLVGTSVEADPAATYAMIENIKTNITFFLKNGEKLDNLEIMSIVEDKVTVKTNGQEIDLR